MKTQSKKFKIVLACLLSIIALLSAITVYALASVGQSSANVTVTNGSSMSISGVTVSNSTLTSACSKSGSVWICTMPTIEQGHNLTTSITLTNSGAGNGQVYTQSSAVKGATDGILRDLNNATNPMKIDAGSSVTLQVVFSVSPNATVGDTIEINSTVY